MAVIGIDYSLSSPARCVSEDDDCNFDKEAMDEFIDRTYIENIWYFSKDKNKDIFRHIKRNTLESFFS